MKPETVDLENFGNSFHQRGRGLSCSPSRQDPRIDTRNIFSTVRRTRSPYRKHSLDLSSPNPAVNSRRPPLPKKIQNSVGVMKQETQKPTYEYKWFSSHKSPYNSCDAQHSGLSFKIQLIF